MSADLNAVAGGVPPGTVEVEELPRWRRRLTLVIPPERVRRERRRVTREYGRRARIPGFRPGHAPDDLIHKRFRPEIEEDVARALLRDALRDAIRERSLDPVSPPVVRSLTLEEGDTLRATAELDVRPEVALARTAGFRIERPESSAPPDAVDRVLERLREERAEARTVGRPAARGDIVVLDVTPLEGGGEPIEGYTVLLGSGEAGPQVEAQLEGAAPGEERDLVVEEPAPEEPGAGLASSAPVPASALVRRRYRVRLREVKERILPTLDDAFAGAISTAGTLEELRARLGDNVRAEAEARAERELRDRLLDAIAEANPVEVPESMVEAYVRRMLRPRGEHGHEEGHAPDHDHGRADAPGEAWTEEQERMAEVLRPAAERALRRHLILEAVGRDAGVEPEEAQMDAYLRERVEEGASVEEARRALERSGRIEDLRAHLRTENVFEHLKRQSTILAAGESPAS